MLEFILFTIPVGIYLIVQARAHDRGFAAAAARVGLAPGRPSSWAWALLLLIPITAIGWWALTLVPAESLNAPGLQVVRGYSAAIIAVTLLRAFGEEALFRGLIGGVLMDRFGAVLGNLLQAAIFLIPHLPILLTDIRLWPIVVAQFLIALLLGWLRHRAGSFIPGVILHAAANLAAAFFILV